jgi:hypothetical protein
MPFNTQLRVPFTAALVFVLVPVLPAIAGPEIQVERDSISGLATGGVATDFVFDLRNSGDQDLIITKVTSSCGCTTAEPASKVIRPGQHIQLKGTYRASDAKPTFVVYVLVESNAVNAPLKRLVIAGRNYPEDIEMSATFLEFQTIEGGTAPPKVFTLKTKELISLEKANLVPKNPDSVPTDSAEVFSLKSIKSSAHELSLVVATKSPKDVGKYAATLVLDAKIGKKSQRLEIPVVLENSHAFLVAPTRVKIPSRAVAKDFSARALVKHHAGQPFEIREVRSPSEAIDARAKKSSPSAYFIYISVNDSQNLPRDAASVRIEVEQSGGMTRVLELPLVFASEQ